MWTSPCIELGAKRHWPQNFSVLFFVFFLIDPQERFCLGETFLTLDIFWVRMIKRIHHLVFLLLLLNICYIYVCMYMDIYLLKLVTLFLLCKHFVIKNHFTLHGKKVSNAQFTCFLYLVEYRVTDIFFFWFLFLLVSPSPL